MRRARPIRQKSREHGLAIGVPGTVAGLTLALEKYGSGKFTLAELIAPAIALARDGYHGRRRIRQHRTRRRSRAWRAGRRPRSCFLKADGALIERGTLLVQSDLADTLDEIARHGPRAFYQGPVADKIAAAVRAAGGLMTADDLKNYKRGRAAGAARHATAASASCRCRRRRPAARC